MDNCTCVDVILLSGTYNLIHELLRDSVHKIHMLCYKLVIIYIYSSFACFSSISPVVGIALLQLE